MFLIDTSIAIISKGQSFLKPGENPRIESLSNSVKLSVDKTRLIFAVLSTKSQGDVDYLSIEKEFNAYLITLNDSDQRAIEIQSYGINFVFYSSEKKFLNLVESLKDQSALGKYFEDKPPFDVSAKARYVLDQKCTLNFRLNKGVLEQTKEDTRKKIDIVIFNFNFSFNIQDLSLSEIKIDNLKDYYKKGKKHVELLSD